MPKGLIQIYKGLSAGIIIMFVLITMNYFVVNNPTFSSLRFFSYFTIQSNCFVAAFFLLTTLRAHRWTQKPQYYIIRSALTVYMTLTVITYWTLLFPNPKIAGGPAFYADIGLHSFAWLALLGDYWLNPPQVKLLKTKSPLFLSYPLLYAIFTGIHGFFTGWFPYPFIDPAVIGSIGLLLVILVVFALMILAMGLAAIYLNNKLTIQTD